MKEYRISETNQKSVDGLIRKFITSCKTKGHHVLIDPKGNPTKTIYNIPKYDDRLHPQFGDTVRFYGGKRIEILKVDGGSINAIRMIPARVYTSTPYLDRLLKPSLNATSIQDAMWDTSTPKLPTPRIASTSCEAMYLDD